jgi:hypothetical protein
MTAEELLAKIQRGEIPTREELEAFSGSPPQKYRVRPLAKVAFEAEVFESISDATEWCRLRAFNTDAVFEIYSKGRVGWRHVYSWYIVGYDPVERQISTELHSIGPLGRADLND